MEVNETPETQCHLIDLTQVFLITEKLVGSLLSPFWTEGRLRFATKQGVTDTTLAAEKFVCKFSSQIHFPSRPLSFDTNSLC